MTDFIVKEIVDPWHLGFVHQALIDCTQDLTDDQFSARPSATSPPIGWHLFHIARWADRLQATFPIKFPDDGYQVDLPNQVWVTEKIASKWKLQPTKLGWLETGPGMSVEDAVSVAFNGKDELLEYAQLVFDLAEQKIKNLNDKDLSSQHYSVFPEMEFNSATGEIKTTGPNVKSILFDLIFHFGHSSRHLGMIEGLRGAIFSKSGTATV